MQFKYGQLVIIQKPGFYRNAQGIVVEVRQETPGKYVYGVDIGTKTYPRLVDIKEADLMLR